MDLRSETGQTFHANVFSWGNLLRLAQMYGWQPAGTLGPKDYCNADWYEANGQDIPRYDNWDGGYWTNDFQEVTGADAEHIATAIEGALLDVPRHDAKSHNTALVRGIPFRVVDGPINPIEAFSGRAGRQFLWSFIEFCRQGAFEIG